MIDPASLPAHAIEATVKVYAKNERLSPTGGRAWEGASAAVAAFLEADGWTVRREWRLVTDARPSTDWYSGPATDWKSSGVKAPPVHLQPGKRLEFRTVLTGPTMKEKP